MKAIRFVRSIPRWLLVRALGDSLSGLASGPCSCIELAEMEPPALPAPDWVRITPVLSGICGSDLSAIACQNSPYFSPFVSTPFVLGHELVGRISELGPQTPPEWKVGTRVVLEPALGCAVRGIHPPCEPCARNRHAQCLNILQGTIAGGIQTGYCRSTGGGWSGSLVSHPAQLHRVPEGLSDELAVLAEPYACALHGALKAVRFQSAGGGSSNHHLLVIGCGSIGLMAIAAYRAAGGRARILAAARYPHQARMAKKLGADEIFEGRGSGALYEWVLARTGGTRHQPELGKPVLLGGPPLILDCVGSSDSIDDALRLAAPSGLVVLVGMPGIPKGVDWTALWYKELRVEGAYAYGWEEVSGAEGGTARVRTVQLALEHLGKTPALAELVNRRHPLSAYRQALDEAWHAGRSGAYKVAFEIRA